MTILDTTDSTPDDSGREGFVEDVLQPGVSVSFGTLRSLDGHRRKIVPGL